MPAGCPLQPQPPPWPPLPPRGRALHHGSVSTGCPLLCSLSVAIPFPEHIVCLLEGGGMRDGVERGLGGFFGTWGCPFGT